VRAATRVNAEQASHGVFPVKLNHFGIVHPPRRFGSEA
jgi:hypothetical protein